MFTADQVRNIITGVTTALLLMFAAWGFSVRDDLGALSSIPGRTAALEGRINALEQRVTRAEADLDNMRREMDRRAAMRAAQ